MLTVLVCSRAFEPTYAGNIIQPQIAQLLDLPYLSIKLNWR